MRVGSGRGHERPRISVVQAARAHAWTRETDGETGYSSERSIICIATIKYWEVQMARESDVHDNCDFKSLEQS